MMKRLAVLVLVSCLVPIAAAADTIQIDWYGPADNSAHIATVRTNAGVTIDTFATFCLEKGEDFSGGVRYPFTVDSVVIEATGSSLQQSGPPPFAVITQGAVELYFAYFNGLFPTLTAADFQNAVWTVQGYNVGTVNASLVPFVTRQTAYDGSLGGAVAYNLYDTSGPRQSFLRVPDGGATLMLLGGALMGLGALRRRFRA